MNDWVFFNEDYERWSKYIFMVIDIDNFLFLNLSFSDLIKKEEIVERWIIWDYYKGIIYNFFINNYY